jgi:hypothetical protein
MRQCCCFDDRPSAHFCVTITIATPAAYCENCSARYGPRRA